MSWDGEARAEIRAEGGGSSGARQKEIKYGKLAWVFHGLARGGTTVWEISRLVG